MDFEREVRFAVVIYGGVSLAIYINGIAQEMLQMVRATATDPNGQLLYPDSSSSMAVYRKLAAIAGEKGLYITSEGVDEDGKGTVEDDGNLRSQFVVDILSGTSAGGINAMYLAKALTNNQSMSRLAQMWIDEADIDLLLNDKHSVEGEPLSLKPAPESLLNSQRMYLKLLDALDGMDSDQAADLRAGKGESRRQSLIERLDLFSTATDLDGVKVPIALTDKEVEELRHRNVFHFRHPSRDPHGHTRISDVRTPPPVSDFTFDNNPFLAYAARCTSAFPFAFEPMALCDVPPIARKRSPHTTQPYVNDTSYWQQFFREYLRDPGGTQFNFRSFGDGGYLDNKPFSYAIETILKRHSVIPVTRKLVYIEPSPATISLPCRESADDRPDAVDNSMMALISLPRYETIRQDLEQLVAWNVNVRRVRRIVQSLDQDMEDAPEPENSLAFRAWYRLRLSATTDALANRVAVTVDENPKSARGDALRSLAGAWRDYRVAAIPDEEGRRAFLNSFLDAYDIDYLQRALRFIYFRAQQSGVHNHELHLEIADLYRRLTDLLEIDLKEEVGAGALDSDQKKHLQIISSPVAAADAGLTGEALRADVVGRRARVKYVLETLRWLDLIDAIDEKLRALFVPILADARAGVDKYLGRAGWTKFNTRDTVFLPLVFGTNLGEVDEIETFRISPKDSSAEDLQQFIPKNGTPKLRGDLLGAFGGFLDKSWRYNDMLWGRLDGAERLITAVLPDADERTVRVRKALIYEAQVAIAEDWNETYGRQIAQLGGSNEQATNTRRQDVRQSPIRA